MDADSVAVRLARLERINRSLNRWLLALSILTVVGSIAMIGFLPFSVVSNVRNRQMIGLTTFGETAVQGFWDAKKSRRLELGLVSTGGPAVHLNGRDETPRLSLSLRRGDEGPAVMLTGPPGRPGGIVIFLGEDDRPEMIMKASSGRGAIAMGFLDDGNPRISLSDNQGNLLFQTPSPTDLEAGDEVNLPRSVEDR